MIYLQTVILWTVWNTKVPFSHVVHVPVQTTDESVACYIILVVRNRRNRMKRLSSAVLLLLVLLTVTKILENLQLVWHDVMGEFVDKFTPSPLDARHPNATLFWNCTNQDLYTYTLPYSGMWWMSATNFMGLNATNFWHSPREDASFAIFRLADRLVMTKDWLDWSVEHLSLYARYFRQQFDQEPDGNASSFAKLRAMHLGYLQERQTTAFAGNVSAAAETLAVLPIVLGNERLVVEDYLNDTHAPDSSNDKSDVLTMYALASTMASLQQIGIKRAVVMGNKVHRPEMVTAAMELVKMACVQEQPMDMEYVYALDKILLEPNKAIHMPNIALAKLHQALSGDLDKAEERAILGRGPCKYIYFSEPDLILHTRPSMLLPLTEQLQSGALIAAHRLDGLPHAADVPNYFVPSKLVPNAANFSQVANLDSTKDACCDQGNYYPGRKEKCGGAWYLCGVQKWNEYQNATPDALAELHARLYDYPMMRLQSGIGVVVVHEHARVCRPVQGGTCD